SHGKLKADQWRTICLINLVIMLCRIWGNPNVSPRDKELLDNYLFLVIAVQWATTRSTSEQHARIVEEYLSLYVQSTLKLFGSRALVFNNHTSFHVPECLHAFGPAHGWWTFPFERFNSILQCFNTNSRVGEMELTLMRSFCRGSNLRALLKQDNIPAVFHKFTTTFSNSLQPNIEGASAGGGTTSGITDIAIDFDELLILPTDTYNSLINCLNEGLCPLRYISYQDRPRLSTWVVEPRVQEEQMIKLKEATFACASKHIGNSCILFHVSNETSEWAGEIHCIFLHRRHRDEGLVTEHFFVVHQFEELNDTEVARDPY
ncbi:hypothetical protein M404DRAFT_125940, partial [Pisolithus tinctorius Marx 270]